MLTDRAIAALKPKPKAHRVTDAAGLFLMVMPGGTKVWRCIYTVAGKRKLHKLGEYPAMSLLDARRARLDVRHAVQQGGDPSLERSAAKLERIERNGQTFEPMTRLWHAARESRWQPAYAKQMMQRLEAHAFPAIGKLPISEVTRRDIKALLDACREKSGAFQADHVRQHLVCAFNEWLDDELIERNPADRLAEHTAPPRRKPQPAVLEVAEVHKVLADFEASGVSPSLKLLHRFQALTGVRPSEARLARWEEFAKPGVWRIPAERMKGRRGRKLPHTVFLSPQAIEVVEVARTLAPIGAEWVFATDNFGTHRHQSFNRSTLADAMQRVLGKRLHVAHGWRASFLTLMAQRHPRDEKLLDAMLAHETKGQVERLYNRTSTESYADTLRRFWSEWADLLLDGAPSAWRLAGDNVVELRRAAA